MPFPVAAYLYHREVGSGQREAQDDVAVMITGTALAPSWAQAGFVARQARVAANLWLQKQETARARRKRSRQVDKVMRRLLRHWPAVFTDPVPLAIGVTVQIRAGMGKGVTTTAIRRAVHRWVTSVGYLSALAGGEERRNLDGSPAGVPSQEHRQRARQQLGTMCAQVPS
ncbi:ProQ/FinO family protein (plasmid) [Lichenicola cladoniae]|uniref:ProQ/FinO family protein n=1 Tax=Lichenicola cladoniae TaxID=1484109 RepID=A0A6M8HXV5_9PROT|nr:ProQ/FinO family protein [Lichenicola cladoniae]NPD69007.1 ProQ/FinO family protein [Acetobacteraceae bacterium]QKE93363.1 ProQ/FinO family protein [Lichenicola cladoniae]